MPTGDEFPVLGWLVMPLVCGVMAAVAAAMHYGVAMRRGAEDIPNLPMAMIGGAVAGSLAALVSLIVWRIIGGHTLSLYSVGILFASLGGEYFGGRCDAVFPAVRAGVLATLILLPLGAGLMFLLRGS